MTGLSLKSLRGLHRHVSSLRPSSLTCMTAATTFFPETSTETIGLDTYTQPLQLTKDSSQDNSLLLKCGKMIQEGILGRNCITSPDLISEILLHYCINCLAF